MSVAAERPAVPAAVKRQLRREVGFGCPIPRCRVPFLEYHHFDPPWAVRRHHEPAGMIPLCPTHHSQAEAFTIEQLHAWKTTAHDRAAGHFEWLRRDVVAVVAGGFHHEVRVPVLVGEPVVWFNRDEAGHLLVNVRMLTTPGLEAERIRIRDNDFELRGDPVDVMCPPSGKVLDARYENGDRFRLEFREIADPDGAAHRYGDGRVGMLRQVVGDESWPVTFVEITLIVGGRPVALTPTKMEWFGNTIGNSMTSHGVIGVGIGSRPDGGPADVARLGDWSVHI